MTEKLATANMDEVSKSGSNAGSVSKSRNTFSSKPLVAPKQNKIGAAMPKMGHLAHGKGSLTPAAKTSHLDDYYQALLKALQEDPDLAAATRKEAGAEHLKAIGGSGATEEEKAARRERIRARQETRMRDGDGAGLGAGFSEDGPTDATVKEILEVGNGERGVPVKSWLVIAAVAAIGIYKLHSIFGVPDSKKKSGSTKKAKKGRAKTIKRMDSPPELEWLDESATKLARKPKKTITKKQRRITNPSPKPMANVGPHTVNISSDENGKAPRGDDTSTASMSSANSSIAAPELGPFGDDRPIEGVMEAATGGADGGADDGAWQTAQRKSKKTKKDLPKQDLQTGVAPKVNHDGAPKEKGKEVTSQPSTLKTSAATNKRKGKQRGPKNRAPVPADARNANVSPPKEADSESESSDADDAALTLKLRMEEVLAGSHTLWS